MLGFSSKRSLIVLTAIVVVLLVFPSLAFAESPHFNYATDSVNSALQLVVSSKESGLGNITSTPVSIAADASAAYQCWNKGGNHPQAGNKETVDGPISAGGDFRVRDGETTGSLTADSPGPGSFSCPSGQSLYLMAVSYANVTISGSAGTLNLPDVSGTGKVLIK